MAIKISLSETESRLFCCSKWWGDPDMPADMPYPTATTEDGEEYPLTFICQIDCADIAAFDPDGELPHEGMLYFFAALDEYLGFESSEHNGIGPWPKGRVVVKHTGHINLETFESYIMVDDQDEPLALPAMKMEFSDCGDIDGGIRLLGLPSDGDVRKACPSLVNLLQIDSLDSHLSEDLQFNDGGVFNILISPEHIKSASWKRASGYLSSL